MRKIRSKRRKAEIRKSLPRTRPHIIDAEYGDERTISHRLWEDLPDGKEPQEAQPLSDYRGTDTRFPAYRRHGMCISWQSYACRSPRPPAQTNIGDKYGRQVVHRREISVNLPRSLHPIMTKCKPAECRTAHCGILKNGTIVSCKVQRRQHLISRNIQRAINFWYNLYAPLCEVVNKSQ